jgi:RNA polymerase sigma factor (sigma-70 family)
MSDLERGASSNASIRSESERSRLDALYRAQALDLRRKLRARVGSADEANDLVQDAFARLAGAQPEEGLRNHAAFLNRIVRNLLIDRSRRRATRWPHVSLDIDIAVRPEQSDAIEAEQTRHCYRAIVASLPPRTRQVFMLHRVDDLSYRQIAERLGIGVRTVEWHIAQAISRISKGLDRG